ncbi:DUF488 domain-containing protein [Paucihalobacter ruber]|uniref:DUF488 domain-containing protein n=1 Tax=Paucihalobacter ruber TaxID=2567861 RepID=A0A506PLS2_9FLAO|nr:DUF488 domain-containing protein [Paucihalobacter ruber]TPV34067.1 DUF488 domain-containing protein [Paucihalobacter ruber]
MFYRRKIILALLELLGGEVEKLRFQKLLFLYAMKKPNPEYDFVPYKFGCYSYSAKADMNTMVKRGYLLETENKYNKTDTSNYLQKLKPADAKFLQQVIADYGQMNSNALIKHTYLNFPFYAIKSTIAKEVLTGKLYERVEKATPKDQEITLFTIGYEGVSLEMYLQKLVKNNVKLLVDVRKNPLSMKFGFSKTLLKRYCNSLDIEYLHIPEVGINSDKRQQLESQSDYDRLFADYCKTTLLETTNLQVEIVKLLQQHKRIALTCFEAEPCQCHRSHLALSISKLPNFKYALIHL